MTAIEFQTAQVLEEGEWRKVVGRQMERRGGGREQRQGRDGWQSERRMENE